MYRVELKVSVGYGRRMRFIVWEFLMYRVELKGRRWKGEGVCKLWFLMYRVELKDRQPQRKCLKPSNKFLMYRVELKVRVVPSFNTSPFVIVPNVPCGVESS